jgi:hypothetical protein
MTAINLNWLDVMRERGWTVTNQWFMGPAGVSVAITTADGRRGSVVVSDAEYPEYDDQWIMHASVSFPDSDPTYADLVTLHRAVFGRKRYAYQCFVPESSHVNIHEHALHLWGRVDGRPMLPDFGAILGSI